MFYAQAVRQIAREEGRKEGREEISRIVEDALEENPGISGKELLQRVFDGRKRVSQQNDGNLKEQ